MGCHHHATQHTLRANRHFRAIVEAAGGLTFRTLLKLIWGQMQTRLHARMIEHAVLFPSGHESKTSQIGEHRPGAILSVEPEQSTLRWDLVRSELARDRREALAEFRSVASVATVAEAAEPLVAVSLRNNCARSDDLPTLASPVASSTDLIQPPIGTG